MCMKFWFDLGNVYEVLRPTTALLRSVTHHISAIEHDKLRRSVDFPQCSKSARTFNRNCPVVLAVVAKTDLTRCGYGQKLGQSKSVKWSKRRGRQQVSACSKVYGVFAVTSETFIDLTNQTSQTEIGAPGQIRAASELSTKARAGPSRNA